MDKSYKIVHTSLTLSNSPVQQTSSQKYLVVILNYHISYHSKFNFNKHLKAILNIQVIQ